MANYGPPGGGSPEPWGGRRPDDAYGRPGEPTAGNGWGAPTPPADPRAGQGWGDPGPGYPPRQTPAADHRLYQPAARSYPPPAGGQPGYQPTEPSYGAGPYGDGPYQPAGAVPVSYAGDPVPPPERGRGRRPMIAVLAVLVVLLLGGGATVYWLLGRDSDPAPVAAPTEPGAAGEPSAAASEPVAAPTAPAPDSSADPRFVKVGQCVRNEGPAGGRPKLLISGCAPKTYEVLRRFDGATSGEKDAEAKCAKVEGYTNWYFFDSELDTLDFVLCLKQRAR